VFFNMKLARYTRIAGCGSVCVLIAFTLLQQRAACAETEKVLVGKVLKFSDVGDYEAIYQMKLLYPQLRQSAQALECFGFAEQERRSMKTALVDFIAASRLAPQDEHVQTSLIFGFYGIASHREALRRANEILALNRKNARARAVQALTLQQMGMSKEAKLALKEAEKLGSDFSMWEAKYNFAFAELEEGQTVRIADACLKALPVDVRARILHGKAMRDVGRSAAAERDFEIVLKKNPNHMTALTLLSTVYRMERKYDQVVACLERRLKLARTERERNVVNRSVAEAYEKSNNLSQAVAARQRVIAGPLSRKKCRNEWEMRDILLCVHDLIELKRWPQAAELLTLVVGHDPHSSEALEKRAICYANMKRPGDAISDYTRLIEVHNDVASWYRQRAGLLKQVGRGADAERDLKKAQGLEAEQRSPDIP